jgi:hypothetical protein
MEWDFSPEDVMNGKVDYGVADFRGDLIGVEKLRGKTKKRLANLTYLGGY